MKLSKFLFNLFIVIGFFGQADVVHAALYDRGNGMIYDDNLNVTWLDAINGKMTWADANNWVNQLNLFSYGGYSDWRLPKLTPKNGSSFSLSFSTDSSTDLGYAKVDPIVQTNY